MSIRTRIVTFLTSLLLLAPTLVPVAAQTPAASPASDVQSSYETTTCMYELPQGFEEGKNAECGYVTAPLRYDGTTNKTIKLAVVKLSSTSKSPAGEPLMILNGGPGQALSAVLAAFGAPHHLYDYLLERQDVILFDQRGMGKSEPSLACAFEKSAGAEPSSSPSASPAAGETASPSASPATDEAAGMTGTDNAKVQKAWNACGDELRAKGLDLTAFNTANNASDIESMRTAMGYDKVDLYGISYGSRLALETQRLYPDSLRAVILSSPFPPEANGLADQIIGFDTSLKMVFANCAKDPECNKLNPNLEVNFHKAVKQLRKTPMVLEFKDPLGSASAKFEMNDQSFMSFLYLGVFVGPLVPFVPVMITTAANNDTSFFEGIAPTLMNTSASPGMGAVTTFWCQDEAPFEPEESTTAAVQKANVMPEVGSDSFVSMASSLYPACAAWNLPASDDSQNTPVTSDVPTLILAGRYDPITPVKNGEMVHKNLPNSQLVVFENSAHDPGSQMTPCAPAILSGFLNEPTKKVDASCAATPVDFSPAPPEDGAGAEGSPEASPAATPKS